MDQAVILNTWYEEDVRGQVIGRYMFIGVLVYEGRKQGKTFYGETVEELRDAANTYIESLRLELGSLFRDEIYPDPGAWSLRVID
jgi:hypothetical protein